MKFGQLLRQVAIPEWRLCYIDYQVLKSLIDLIIAAIRLKDREKLTLSVSDLNRINQIITVANKHFYKFHHDEIFLTFAFVQYKVIFLANRRAEFDLFNSSVDVGNQVFLSSIESLYVEVSYLDDLLKVNLEGERKILKKHKKIMKKANMHSPDKFGWIIERMQPTIKELKDAAEQTYISKSPLVSKQSRVNIRELLLVEHSSTIASFFFGMGVGVAISIIVVIIALLSYAQIAVDSDPLFVRDFHVFRGNLLLIIYIWMFAFNIFTFQKFHINYKLIFNMGTSETSSHMFSRNSIITAVFLIFLLTWVIERVIGMYSGMIYFGGISWLFTCTYFFIPIPFWNWRGRFYMLKLIGRAILAPIFGVDFPITWLTDQVVSLVTSFKDLAYTICYYTSLDLTIVPTTSTNQCSAGANISVVFLVGMMAFVWRMLQCIRQGIAFGAYFSTPFFINTLKYLTSLITLTLSFVYSSASKDIFPLWCVFSAISTIFSYIWDLKMDWGFFQKGTKHRFLRENLAYGSPVIYYIIMAVNFVLRLSWILTLSPNIVNSFRVKPIVFTLITGALEIIRRAIWNLLRVEKEHIANCVNLEAIKYNQAIKELQQPDAESSTRLGLNQTSERQLKEERNNKLKSNVYKLISKKKDKLESISKMVKDIQKQLNQIQKRCLHPSH